MVYIAILSKIHVVACSDPRMIFFERALRIKPVSEQILSPRRFCPPGHNVLAEIGPHGHNPLADIVPLPQILSPILSPFRRYCPPPPPPPPLQCLAVPGFLIGVRSYKPRPLFTSSQKGKLSTHTLSLPLQSRSAINLPSRQTSWLRP